MSATWGWALAVVATALGYAVYGWRGVVLVASVMVFWLLLQFSRAMRVMRLAGQAPVGRVPSAVMLQARLRRGMRLMDIIMLTRSLGEKRADEPETWRWTDESGAAVEVELAGGRCTTWRLTRPDEPSATPAAPATPDA